MAIDSVIICGYELPLYNVVRHGLSACADMQRNTLSMLHNSSCKQCRGMLNRATWDPALWCERGSFDVYRVSLDGEIEAIENGFTGERAMITKRIEPRDLPATLHIAVGTDRVSANEGNWFVAESARIGAFNDTRVRAYNSATVIANHNVVVEAHDHVAVTARDRSIITAYDHATVYVEGDEAVVDRKGPGVSVTINGMLQTSFPIPNYSWHNIAEALAGALKAEISLNGSGTCQCTKNYTCVMCGSAAALRAYDEKHSF